MPDDRGVHVYSLWRNSTVRLTSGSGMGTGVCIAPDTILTAAHVVEAGNVRYQLNRGLERAARLYQDAVGSVQSYSIDWFQYRPDTELALLKTKPGELSLIPVTLSRQLAVLPGSTVWGIGNFAGEPGRIYPATVGYPRLHTLFGSPRPVFGGPALGDTAYTADPVFIPEYKLKLHSLSCWVGPGDSGGPLFDEEGGLCFILSNALPGGTLALAVDRTRIVGQLDQYAVPYRSFGKMPENI